MDEVIHALLKSTLFKGFSRAEISVILKILSHHRKEIEKGNPLALEGDPCPGIGILTKGSAEIQRVYTSGKSFTIDTLKPGDSFGEIILFSDVSWYPVTIIARENTQAIFLSRKAVIDLCGTHPLFLTNLLRQLSNRIILLNERLKSLSYQTIRQKIANLLLDECNQQHDCKFELSYSRKEMADKLGIPRPSLSRELALMKQEGLIEFQMNSFTILNPDEIRKFLLS